MAKKNTINLFINNVKNKINYGAESINKSQFFIALIMIIMNIGSKYIAVNFSKSQEAYLKVILGRQLLIFSVAFMATRNVITSFVILLIFVILADYAFNEDSQFCILPQSFKDLKHSIDLDGDGKISKEEVAKALEVLKKSKLQNENLKKKEAFTKFKSTVNI